MSIQPLPPDVVAQIKSATTITSLNGVIYELIKNSLDAEATKITIDVDYGRGGCVVEDDGVGIMPREFDESGGLGKSYHTSKSKPQKPLHGHQGTFLSSLSALALTKIISRHHKHHSQNSLTLHRSEVISRQTPALAQHRSSTYGTKVVVRDLFGAMPVRVKQRAILAEKQGGNLKDWEELKRQIVHLLLSWDERVFVTVRDVETHQKLVLRGVERSECSQSSNEVSSLLAQATLISPEDKPSWVSINASTSKLEMAGAISLEPSPTKSVQFLSLGIHPLFPVDGHSLLHDEINRLFSNSSFGNEEEGEDLSETERSRRANDARYKSDGYTNKELKGGRKGVDRWPKFYIKIQPSQTSPGLTVGDILDHRGSRVSLVLELVQAMIQAFLTKYHFRPKGTRRQGLNKERKHDGTENVVAKSARNSPGKDNNQILRSCLKSPKSIPLDLFGSNVKFPSIQISTSQPDSSLDPWSRIKSGRPLSRPESPMLQRNTIHDPVSVARARTAPPSIGISGRSTELASHLKSIARPSTPLLSKEGKLVRRPFEEVVESSPFPQIPLQAPTEVDEQTDRILWINPITKVRSLVNTRTGHTIPEKELISSLANPRENAPITQFRLTSRQMTNRKDGVTSPWLRNILNNWENPVFQPTELAIPQVSFDGASDQTKDLFHGRNHHCDQIHIDRAFKESSSLHGRISKEGLKRAQVISQVDNKFILVRIDCNTLPASGNEMLVIIDQHAADERIRIESLMEGLCAPTKDLDFGIVTTKLDKLITFDVPPEEFNLLQIHRPHFVNWGILYSLSTQKPAKTSKPPASSVTVHSLPPLIQERCKQEPRLLIQLIRTELWKVHDSNGGVLTPPTKRSLSLDWLEKTQSCPQGIIDMMNSRACRSAIMFNDILTQRQCEMLVRKLAECKFPFQCCHGRPSMVPLVDLSHLPQFSLYGNRDRDEQDFGATFGKWRQTRGIE